MSVLTKGSRSSSSPDDQGDDDGNDSSNSINNGSKSKSKSKDNSSSAAAGPSPRPSPTYGSKQQRVLYDLCAVVCHSGTLDMGHYVAYLRRLSAIKDARGGHVSPGSGPVLIPTLSSSTISGSSSTADLSSAAYDDGVDENASTSVSVAFASPSAYEWVRCDDEKVAVVSEDEVRDAEGYIFTYIRRLLIH